MIKYKATYGKVRVSWSDNSPDTIYTTCTVLLIPNSKKDILVRWTSRGLGFKPFGAIYNHNEGGIEIQIEIINPLNYDYFRIIVKVDK